MSAAKANLMILTRFVWTPLIIISSFVTILSVAASGVVLRPTLAQTPSNAPPGVNRPQQSSSPAVTGSPQQPSSPAATTQDARPGFGLSLLQSLITACVAAGLTVLLAWAVGLRIAAAWDIRKKQAEFDILLAKEFYELVGDVKAIAREWELLLRRKPPPAAIGSPQASPPTLAGSSPQPSPTDPAGSSPQQPSTEWQKDQLELAKRAMITETSMEAILLKLVSESNLAAAAGSNGREGSLRVLGLFRVAFRNLREMIETGTERPPDFGSPEFWLFNRLVGEISKMVYARSTRSPQTAKVPTPAPDAENYLRLIAFRTTDLRVAAANLIPPLIAFFQARNVDRDSQRLENIRRKFPAGTATVDAIASGSTSGTSAAP
jgi:hypothetical protein